MHAYSHYYVLSASGKNSVSKLNILLNPFAGFGCNIIKSKMAVMGNEIIANILLGGNWGAMAKLESAIPKLEVSSKFKISLAKTEYLEELVFYQTYTLEVNSLDKIGSLSKLINFLKTHKIMIHEISTGSYLAQNKTPMLHMSLKIDIPESVQIIRFRDELSDYSEVANLDTYLEICKN